MRHFIKKQHIDLTIRTRKDAFRLQQLISELYWRDIVRVLDKVFDEFSEPGETMQIDRLEVDLGELSEKDIEKGKWAEVLFTKISEKLKLLRHAKIPGTQHTAMTEMLSAADQWLFYMQQGHLPWNIKTIDDEWRRQVLEAMASDYTAIEKLRNIMLGTPIITNRIYFQHSKEFIVSLLEAMTANSQKELPSIIDELADLLIYVSKWDLKNTTAKKRILQQELWKAFILFAARYRQKARHEKFVKTIIESGPWWAESIAGLPRKFFSAKRITGPILIALKLKIKKDGTETDNVSRRKNREKQNQERVKDKSVDSMKGELVPEELSTLIAETTPKKTDENPGSNTHLPDEAIYVQHAGLVLLHPFLKVFFKKLSLVDKNEFISTSIQQKAIFLLYYLATGRVNAPEHELVMEKLLCNYPLQMPVSDSIELNEDELNEAVVLLQEVIRHWKILQNTSPDGLRESFLQRSGKLSTGKDGPLLQVEQSSIDVLLDDIPWNYSMFQLPWRKDLIRVEW